nr:PAS domain S-box protein [Chloroflexota bacterium]
RRKAELKWIERKLKTGPLPETNADIRRIVHEMGVHQIELEIQNEELIATRNALEIEKFRYEELFEFAPDGYLVTDSHGVIMEVNQMAKQLLGKPTSYLVGKPLAIFIHQDNKKVFRQRLNKLVEKDRLSQWELIIKPGSGDPFPASFSVTKTSSTDGATSSLRWILQDITERVQAKEALQESEEKLHLALESANADSWEMNLVTAELSYGDQWARYLGYKPGEVHYTIEGTTNILHPDDITNNQKALETCLSNQESTYETETRIRRKDGTYAWVLSRGKIVERDKNGNPVRLIGTNIDITERKQAEQALSKGKNVLKAIVDNIPIMISRYDPDANILYLNTEFEKIVGWKTEEVEDIDLMEKVYPDPVYRHQALEFMQKASTDWGEFQIQSKSGEIIDSEWANIRLEDGTQIGIGIDTTERKRAENAIRESEEKFRLITETSMDSIFQLDLDGNILYMNPSGTRMYGNGPDEMEGMNFASLLNPERLDEGIEYVRKVLAGESIDGEMYVKHRDGHEFPIQFSMVPSMKGRDIVGFSGFSRDISERKQAEKELHIAMEKYRVLFESLPLGVSVTDAAGNIVETNRESERLLGISNEEHTQRKHDGPEWGIVRPDETPMPAEEYAGVRALKEKQLVENVEMGIVKDGGKILWTNVTSAPIPLEGFGVTTTFGDITARKHAEEQLRLQSAALNAAANAIIITNHAGTIEWINPAFTRLTGYSAAEAIGKNPRELIKSGDQDIAVYKDLWDTILAGKIWRGELINRRKDGSLYTEEQTITPLRNGDGMITHFIAVKQDITERILASEALRHMSTHDALTGLYNRGFFVEQMARLERGRKFPISIMMADLDRLKDVNDQQGHAAGDAVLKRVAQVLTAAFRAEDVVARLGGDEFAVLLPATDAPTAKIALQRVRQAIQENNSAHAKTPFHISIGLSTAEASTSLSLVLKKADMNMYREKRGLDAS